MSQINILSNQVANAKSDSLECEVACYATSRLSFEAVNALRKQSSTLPGNLGNSMLRHCDEQTLTALVAVRDTAAKLNSSSTDFHNWGVVASSRYLGRSAFAQNLARFPVEGPWNVSVQVVPNRSLHSPASMIGLALGCHGPCVGVGGGLDGETDAWLTALSLLQEQRLPGMWLVYSGWEPELQIGPGGAALSESTCTALALALRPAVAHTSPMRMRIVYDARDDAELEVPAKSTAIQLFEEFAASEADGERMAAALGGGLRLVIDRTMAAVPTIPISVNAGEKKAA